MLARSYLVLRAPLEKAVPPNTYRKAAPALVEPLLRPSLHARSRAGLQLLLHQAPPARRAGGAAAQKSRACELGRSEKGPCPRGSACAKRRDHATSPARRVNVATSPHGEFSSLTDLSSSLAGVGFELTEF